MTKTNGQTLLDEFRVTLAPEIEALKQHFYEQGRADAINESRPAREIASSDPDTAAKLAVRARILQADNPNLSSIDAVRKAYIEAGIPLE